MADKKEVELLSPDDHLYLKETLAEVRSLQSSANTLLNFCQGRLAKKYNLIEGCGMNEETGTITRPKLEVVKDEKHNKEDTNQPVKEDKSRHSEPTF